LPNVLWRLKLTNDVNAPSMKEHLHGLPEERRVGHLIYSCVVVGEHTPRRGERLWFESRQEESFNVNSLVSR
jgi:hypothetical protein